MVRLVALLSLLIIRQHWPAVRVEACDLLLGGQQRISGGRGGKREGVFWGVDRGEEGSWEVGSSGFPKVEGEVVLGEEESLCGKGGGWRVEKILRGV